MEEKALAFDIQRFKLQEEYEQDHFRLLALLVAERLRKMPCQTANNLLLAIHKKLNEGDQDVTEMGWYARNEPAIKEHSVIKVGRQPKSNKTAPTAARELTPILRSSWSTGKKKCDLAFNIANRP